MSTVLSPLISGFETYEQAASHDHWLRAQVQASLDDTRPGITHDQVMAEMDAIIAQSENESAQQIKEQIQRGLDASNDPTAPRTTQADFMAELKAELVNRGSAH